MVAFLSAFAIQYGLYHRLLRDPLRTRDLEQVQPALKRWIKVAVAWQVLVLTGCVLYLAVLRPAHGSGVAWVSPAAGAAFGTAIPLQLVAMAILRSARSSL